MGTKRIWASLDPFFEQGPVMGRTQANAGFLDGLLRLDPYDAYRFYLPSKAACEALKTELSRRHPSLVERGRVEVATRRNLPAALAADEHHVFHLSDCILMPGFLAALRNARSGQIFPITSVTHSLSYARYGQDFLKHLSPCTSSRDAVVATSRAGAEVVRAYYHSLREGYRLDPERFPEPRVEHIPLGVDLASYSPPGEEARRAARAEAGYGGETVFLVLARLCHSSKMDFLPILRAFQRVLMGGVPPEGVRLVLAGWTDEEDWGRRALEDMARNIGLPLSVEERPSHERKLLLYAAADVFLSPSDNLQETFGLTLLEAQAMGLPVIASDFDGYRDLVRHEATGLLVPTTGLGLTTEVDLLAPLSFDNHTHLLLAQRLAVDVPSMAEAIARLAGDAALRRDMGRRARAGMAGYAWEAIAARHVELWERLRELPVPRRGAAAHPVAVPYAAVFGSYPSHSLETSPPLVLSRLGNAVYRGQDFPVVYEGLEGVLPMEALRPLLVLARKPLPALALCERLRAAAPHIEEEQARALVLWCLKHDLLERSRD